MATKRLALLLAVLLCACAVRDPPPRATPSHPIVTSGYFSLPDGAKLPFRLYPAEGPTRAVVLALHGYTDSRDGWQMLAGVLNARGIAVYAPDQSGFGATADRGRWPGTERLVREAHDMAVLLRRRYPAQKLYLMGESMGGAVALLAGSEPDPPPVDGYILSAPAVWGGSAMNPALRAILRVASFTAPNKRLAGRAARVTASDNLQALIAFGRDPLTLPAPSIANIAGLVQLMGAAQAACARFDQPALILYGGRDELIPPAAMRRCWAALPPEAVENGRITLAFYPRDCHLIERDRARAKPDADIVGFILQGRAVSDAPSQATIFQAAPLAGSASACRVKR